MLFRSCPLTTELCRSTRPPERRLADGTRSRCHFESSAPTPAHEDRTRPSPASGAATVLVVTGLCKTFKVPSGRAWFGRSNSVVALDDVALELRHGETLAIVGESGSGKSTLARCIAGLLVPSRGSIRFAGEPLGNRRSLMQHRHVQIVFQNPDAALNPLQTVEQIIARPLKLYGLRRGVAVAERVAELLNLVRLGERFMRRAQAADVVVHIV